MIIVTGKQTALLTKEQLRERIAPYKSVVIDVGAGDGRFAYRYAQQNPERFVIALDPVRENLRELSAKAARKPERGGVPNVLYVVSSIEQLPPELDRLARKIFVTLPWGSLMRGIILGEPAVLEPLARLGRKRASVHIVLNTRIFDDPVPIDARDLPEVTPGYGRTDMARAFERAGMRIDSAEWLDADEVATLGTTWAKRLSHRSPPRSVVIEATVTHAPADADDDRDLADEPAIPLPHAEM